MASDEAIVGGCICFWLVVITSCILLGLSFSLLELDEWGLIYDTNKQIVERTPYGSGRYFTGLGRKFI